MPLAVISILLNALAQVTIKSLANSSTTNLLSLLKHWQLYATGGLYAISILTWFLALKTMPLNVAYPMQALGYVVVVILSWIVFNEGLGPIQIAGLVVIIAGVFMLSSGTSS